MPAISQISLLVASLIALALSASAAQVNPAVVNPSAIQASTPGTPSTPSDPTATPGTPGTPSDPTGTPGTPGMQTPSTDPDTATRSGGSESAGQKPGGYVDFGESGGMQLNFGVSGNATALNTDPSYPGPEFSTTVGVFVKDGQRMTATGRFLVLDHGSSIEASPVADARLKIPAFSPSTMRFVSVDYKLPSGSDTKITVGISKNGVMLVRVPRQLKRELNERQITLVAMTIAKKRLNVGIKEVQSVVIQIVN